MAQSFVPAILSGLVSVAQHTISEAQETTRQADQNRPTQVHNNTHSETSKTTNWAVVSIQKTYPPPVIQKPKVTPAEHLANGLAVGAGAMAGAAIVGGLIVLAKNYLAPDVQVVSNGQGPGGGDDPAMDESRNQTGPSSSGVVKERYMLRGEDGLFLEGPHLEEVL